jgi:hypothetical protein
MFRRFIPLTTLVLALACSERATPPTAPDPPSEPVPVPEPDPGPAPANDARAAFETMAREVALALADPAFRARLGDDMARSPWRERKLHADTFLQAALPALPSTTDGNAIVALADRSPAAELYFPVEAHRAAWDGGPDLLVATAMDDDDVPIAFDTHGRRFRLDPDRPPAVPVLALVPRESAIARLPSAECMTEECVQPWGSGGGEAEDPPTYSTGSLTLTHAEFVDDFEGWLKGKPEFELHILGPLSQSDTTTMTSYQCIGEHAPPGYFWDMNDLSWDGRAKMFSYEQMDAFEAAYPGRAYVVFALEDDTDACRITSDGNRFREMIDVLKRTYNEFAAAKDVKIDIDAVGRLLQAARTGADLLAAIGNVITTKDDPIGIAVADTVAGRSHPNGNWVVLNEANQVNGWLNLQMR